MPERLTNLRKVAAPGLGRGSLFGDRQLITGHDEAVSTILDPGKQVTKVARGFGA
ncbi:MAG: hypothetical protein ACFBZ8_08605 [Opitutales bacterium]